MRDFYHLNDFKYDDENILEWDYLSKYIYIYLPRRDEKIIYDNGRLEHYIAGRLMNSYDKGNPPKNIDKSYRLDGKCPKSIDLTFERCAKEAERFIFINALKNGEVKKPITRMRDYELYNYYSNLDKENCNIQHLAYVENLMIDRNLEIFTKRYEKHDLNNPILEDFIERGLREYEF